ncbi:MAG: bifunctional phosphoribosyl-AMP cyclohydrolase/phosphoribosyl-ATP diphosphatase HisIE [Clostridia bacterium]|nr:bifunctional phosphoribosyl-AMP cyclohydrolase/phosphoribosyl-ATP diphosphatase HisIE [Clostridia bacterium]
MELFIDNVKFDEKGLVPCVVQDASSGEILMLAYMNRESLEKTIETKTSWFYSRSRQKLWNKGETSGNFQHVKDILLDCDGDSIVLKVTPQGPACHTGHKTCFYRKYDNGELVSAESDKPDYLILNELCDVVRDRMENPKEDSYTNYLLDCGIDKILKKVGEECSETIIAAKNADKDEISLETSDLLYHLVVMLVERGMDISDVYKQLRSRR